MDKFERVYRLDRLLKERRTPVSLQSLCEMFECSESTAKRTIRDLKYLGAPIYCTEGQGYRYDRHIAFELPGVWFSPEELHALLTIEHLAASFAGGLFRDRFRTIESKAQALLGEHLPSPRELSRIRVLAAGSRGKDLPMFAMVASGVLGRRRLHLTYCGRQRGERTEREVSPQRLVHYRGNWYLDAWCHRAEALRIFAVERIEQARMLGPISREVVDAELDMKLTRSFGIFAGEPAATAVLHFSEKAARWVRDEEWFPEQQAVDLPDGGLELCIPYADPTELVMEICRHGPEVEVVGPPALRRLVADKLRQAADQYG